MPFELIKRLAIFITLCVVQILFLNHIRLFGVATPMIYVLFVIIFHRNTPKWALLLWSFALGLAIDVFSNTPGLAAGSMTLIAIIQPYLLELFIPRDSIEELRVSSTTLGLGKYIFFCTILIAIYCLVFYALEAFSFYNWIHWLTCAGSSALLTLILILSIETVRKK
ncbi:MAG: rod shape-determining protein MreD [Prevotella sp.]|nr:rod shape-determining protein MreD [Prevotella sp.]MBR0524680.1 rod shape-determining protein MreD [Prevotella sp.]